MRRVGILGVDETQTHTVYPLGEPIATFWRIWLRDSVTGIEYKVYPEGEQAYCTPGASNLGAAIAITNNGEITGDLFIRVINADTGVLLFEWTLSVAPGETVGPPGLFYMDMPTTNLNLIFEAGH